MTSLHTPRWLRVLTAPRAVFKEAARESRGLGVLAALVALELMMVYPLSVASSVMRLAVHPVAALSGLWTQLVRYGIVPLALVLGAALGLHLWARRRGGLDLWAAASALAYAYVPHTLLVAAGVSLAAAGLDVPVLPHHALGVGASASLLFFKVAIGWGPSLLLGVVAAHVLLQPDAPAAQQAKSRSFRLVAALAVSVLASGLVAASVHVARNWELARPLLPGDRAPAFRLASLDGAALSSGELVGQVALIDFWATWCPPCVASMPHLERLHRELSRDGFRLVSVNVEPEAREAVHAFRRRLKLSFPVYIDGGALQRAMKVQSYPTAVLLDQSGIVRRVYVGATSYEEMRADVVSLLRAAANN